MISALFCVVTLFIASPCLDTDMVPGMSLVDSPHEQVFQTPVVPGPVVLAARKKDDDAPLED